MLLNAFHSGGHTTSTVNICKILLLIDQVVVGVNRPFFQECFALKLVTQTNEGAHREKAASKCLVW